MTDERRTEASVDVKLTSKDSSVIFLVGNVDELVVRLASIVDEENVVSWHFAVESRILIFRRKHMLKIEN